MQYNEIHCEKLKTRYNFYASFKVTLQGVEMEDALSSHIWPSGILVKKFSMEGLSAAKKAGTINTQQQSTMAAKTEELSVVTCSCRGLTASLHDIEQLCAMNHIIFLQETWLAKQTLDKLTDISDNHFACVTAEVDYTKGITSGRPYGRTAILWKKS